MRPDPASRALNAIVRDLIETRDGATYFAGRVWGVDTHYDIDGSHPLVGHSVPNFELTDGTEVGELLRDGRGLLIDFDGDDSLQEFVSHYGDRIRYVARGARARSGLSAALVRPDGIVAWASASQPDYQELHAAAARWFVTS